MLTLHIFPEVHGAQPSGPCHKVEVFLRLVGQEYAIERGFDLSKAPKGKFPLIDDDGRLVDDSEFILRYLHRTYGLTLDDGLSGYQHGLARGMRRITENSLYIITRHCRWVVPEQADITPQLLMAGMPPDQRAAMAEDIRARIKQADYLQGYGRHSEDELKAVAKDDLAALAAVIAENGFVIDDRPRNVDCSVYAQLATSRDRRLTAWLPEMIEDTPALVAYLARMQDALENAKIGTDGRMSDRKTF